MYGMCVCLYVCMYVCVYVFMNVCMCVLVGGRWKIGWKISWVGLELQDTHTYIYTHIHTYTLMYTHVYNTYIHMYIHRHASCTIYSSSFTSVALAAFTHTGLGPSSMHPSEGGTICFKKAKFQSTNVEVLWYFETVIIIVDGKHHKERLYLQRLN